MAKVLRLHKGSKDTINGWAISTKIGSKAIDSIEDPVGANDNYEITSIPSPFARIDLVKRAFKIVADTDLDGNTAYHKLVSDALDVGQLFFNIGKYRNMIEIIVWDRQNAIAELKNADNEAHRRLGRTYETYLQQDGAEYNFDQMDCLYLLNFIDPSAPRTMNIIGATSPATIFFTSANELSYVGRKIRFGNDTPFDADYKPLYKRDFEYIRYWWSLKHSRNDFAKRFPEVNHYLEKCFPRLLEKQREELQQIQRQGLNYYKEHYEQIPVRTERQQYVTILDQKLLGKRSLTTIESGFEMKVSKGLPKHNDKIPLALPVETYTERIQYVIDLWDKNTKVPYEDKRPLLERTLPDDGTKYPYVTISDFLEDTIVKIPYGYNATGFFNGNDERTEAEDSFLLPIKPFFFNYFSTDDLMSSIEGRKRIELQRLTGEAVKVILRIPIKAGGYVQYERIYFRNGKASAELNKGTIVEKEFTLGIYPSIKYPDGVDPYYRVALLDRDSVAGDDNRYTLTFYDDSNEKVDTDPVVRRNRSADNVRIEPYKIDSSIYPLRKGFQYISVEHETEQDIHGVIIPKFSAKRGSRLFRFAIDFGTTNTHIEYSIDGQASNAFDISQSDMQMQQLHYTESDTDITDVFNSDFIPAKIGKDSLYNYPMRTVLSETNSTNWSTAVFSMAHVNIPFTFEKNKILPYDMIHTDLKWSTQEVDNKRAEKYIENILIMLRNKVLLNNGDLTKTEIVWFYPASMTQNRFNKFRRVWKDLFVSIFNAPSNNIVALSESTAPYTYYKTRKGATSTVVSVDIGGGTTDVLFAEKGEAKYLTSFRFAANSIFGDGYSFDAETNGFVSNYKNQIMKLLEDNKLGALKEVFQSILEQRISTDIMAFLFSLAKNKDVKSRNIVIDVNKKLADDNRGKYVIILFYTAIMYHIAHLMKAKGMAMPRHITFSGNGSKVLAILSADDETLAKFTKIIFEQVYGYSYDINGLDIIRPDNSKEATCKGGILMKSVSEDYDQIKQMKTILIGYDDHSFVSNDLKYDDVTNRMKEQVVDMVRDFVQFAFDLNKHFSFYDNFDIDRKVMEKVKALCQKDILNYLDNGINLKKESIMKDGADDVLEETLFFYPIVGMLNAVNREVYKMQ
ncbi:MAG: hypothetical protein MR448_06260 [Parabacteroides sp.]|nr:hypothetical protein [Parabacteroides sp.]